MELRQLKGLDSVFLSAEGPAAPLHIMAVLLLDPSTIPGGYEFGRLRDFFASRLHRIPPLRRRLVEVPLGLGRPYWVDDPGLDLDYHLRRAMLPRPGSAEQLADMAAEMNEGLLQRDRPLWQIHVVEGLEGGRIALIAKLHHALMDGVAGMHFLATLLGRTPESVDIEEEPIVVHRSSAPGPGTLAFRALFDLAGRPWRIAKATAATVAQQARRGGTDGAAPAPLEAPRTVLNGLAGSGRRVAYTSIALPAVRDVASVARATVNDVVLTVVAGALRRALDADGTLPRESLVAGVPVSIHQAGDDRANAYSAMLASIFTDEPDPVARLFRIRDGIHAAKAERSGAGGGALDVWADVPLPVEVLAISRVYSALCAAEQVPVVANCVVSNVRGSPVPLYLGGARLVGIHALGPIFDGMTLNVTVLGREDALDFGIVAGSDAPRELWGFARAIPEELDALGKGFEARDHARVRSEEASTVESSNPNRPERENPGTEFGTEKGGAGGA